MRICIKHREKAVDTLTSAMDGTEFDVCAICREELTQILDEKPIEVENGRKRVSGRPKTVKK